ncbi:MAG TPA: Clp protease N-terminal domain-containing protein [Capsulimonadaceae bacterium]|nr:Clp protease N-terminal domain-containing protein [Capsulimonadaceae bacterium]
MPTMWQRFTEKARRSIYTAQQEAESNGENYVSTEHFLLGLLSDEECVAAKALLAMGLSPPELSNETRRQMAPKGPRGLSRDRSFGSGCLLSLLFRKPVVSQRAVRA